MLHYINNPQTPPQPTGREINYPWTPQPNSLPTHPLICLFRLLRPLLHHALPPKWLPLKPTLNLPIQKTLHSRVQHMTQHCISILVQPLSLSLVLIMNHIIPYPEPNLRRTGQGILYNPPPSLPQMGVHVSKTKADQHPFLVYGQAVATVLLPKQFHLQEAK